jgi:hypothetical protein
MVSLFPVQSTEEFGFMASGSGVHAGLFAQNAGGAKNRYRARTGAHTMSAFS